VKIHTSSGGMPGYLTLIRKLVSEAQVPLTQILSEPGEVESLLQIQWRSSGVDNDDFNKKLMAFVAFSITPLPVTVLAELCSSDLGRVRAILQDIGLVTFIDNVHVQLEPELLKNIAQNRLKYLQQASLDTLVKYYEKVSETREANLLLPEYYRLADNYEALTKWLAPAHLVPIIQDRREINSIKRDLLSANDMAKQRKDTIGLLRFGIAASQIHQLSVDLVGESEVEALIALRQFEKALRLTYSARLISAQIRLLAKIYVAMERSGATVPRQALVELEHMTGGLNSKMDPQDLLMIATDLFPILPDTATSLIERAKDQEDASTALDLAAALASFEFEGPRSDEFVERIENLELRDLALIGSLWLNDLPADDLMRKAAQSDKTKTKEYLYRQWALQNRRSPQIHLVLEAALDTVIGDPAYRVSLRHLRQLSEAVRYCDQAHRETLIRRFDVPNFTSLRSPIEERLRLELNLAQAMQEISNTEAHERFMDSYREIQQMPLDVDVACYCYARLLITNSALDPDDTHDLKRDMRKSLDDKFLQVLESSADQLEITERTLRALTLVDPLLAITYAGMLNMRERREEGYKIVAEAYVRQDQQPVQETIIARCIADISNIDRRDTAVRDIAIEARITGKMNNATLRDQLIRFAEEVKDPIKKCQSLAHIIGGLSPASDMALLDTLFNLLVEAWHSIDITWIRVEAAFDLVDVIAKSSQSYATELYDAAKELRNTSAVASQSIGTIYYETLELATRLAGYMDLTKEDAQGVWRQLLSAITIVPSKLLQARLLALSALGQLRNGDKKTFDEMIRSRVLPVLHSAPQSELYEQVLVDGALAVFEYSQEEAKNLLSKLSYESRNHAWSLIALHVIRNTNLGDPTDSNPPNVSIDQQIVNKVLFILDNVDRDQSVSYVATMLAHEIEDPTSYLNETQKLDTLVKLESLVTAKLPDVSNITHAGYKLICLAAIERARRIVAKRSKPLLKKNQVAILLEVEKIPNVADRAFVMARVAEEFRDFAPEDAEALLAQAAQVCITIPNVKDRIGRLETVTQSYAKLNKSSEAKTAIRMAVQFAQSLEDTERDQVLASIIETAHQFDPELAAQLTEKIEEAPTREEIEKVMASLDLAKSPNKLQGVYAKYSEDDEVLLQASRKMLKSVMDRKGASHPTNVLVDWLSCVGRVEFATALTITQWFLETSIRQAAISMRNQVSTSVVTTILQNLLLLEQVGGLVSFLSTLPPNIRENLGGLSLATKVFRVGERDHAIRWIEDWLQTNVHEYVKICDPYFDFDQLWVLKSIPTNVEVKIVTTGEQLGLKRNSKSDTNLYDRDRLKQEKSRLASQLDNAWKSISQHASPPTLFVIHSTVFGADEEFHDRFITTANAGLSIGSSLNGLGNKEFAITILGTADVQHVEEEYIDRRLNIQANFSQLIYLELG